MDKINIAVHKTNYPYRIPKPNTHPKGCGVSGCLQCEDTENPLVDPHCVVCGGNSGFVHPTLPDGRPDGSKVIPCPAKGCHASGILGMENQVTFDKKTGLNRNKTFATFLTDISGVQSAFEYAKQLASLKSNFAFLTISGSFGCGKTHLAYAIGNEIVKAGVAVHMFPVQDLLAKMRLGMQDNTLEHLIGKVKDIFCLILDDYVVNYHSDWATSRLEEIINYRYAAMMPTVITTKDSIDDFPEAIASRLVDKEISVVVHNGAVDFRATKKSH